MYDDNEAVLCPLPIAWDRIYNNLLSVWKVNGQNKDTPPIPLILAGWAYSNDAEKQQRWRDTVNWAKRNDCIDVITLILEEEYRSKDPTSYSVGPFGGHLYLPWSYEPKIRPSSERLKLALEHLQAVWFRVAGEPLSSYTHPLMFTGRRARRLLVNATSSFQPNWGTWTTLNADESRRAFTKLRAAVNADIRPHVVDHIDFYLYDHDKHPAADF